MISNEFDQEYAQSDEISDDYQDALMSSLVALNSNYDSEEKSDEKKPTECRIEFVKNILVGNELKPMINFDNFNTECATSNSLNKKIIDVRNLFSSLNVKLLYIKSGTTGHTFKAISKKDKNVAFAVKVCAYPKDEYGGMNNPDRPENAELRMLKLLSYFVIQKNSPHFVLPIGTFNTSITNFINVPKNMINLSDEKNEMYKKFVKKYHEDEFENFVSVLISEWCNGGDLLDYIRKNYKEMKLKHWIVIIFQILFTLALIQKKYPTFRHNDMKANNILVLLTKTKPNQADKRYGYSIDNWLFSIPNIDLQIKIWDYDFACIDGVIENNKVNADWTKRINISKKQNRYYDMHYFFNTLISKRFFPQFYKGGAPPEIVEFIHRIIPEKYRKCNKYVDRSGEIHYDTRYVNKKGRIQVNVEYTTPYQVITKDPLFQKYRFINQKYRFN